MSNTEALRAAAHQALAAMEKYPVTVNHWKAVLLPAADALRAALAQRPAAPVAPAKLSERDMLRLVASAVTRANEFSDDGPAQQPAASGEPVALWHLSGHGYAPVTKEQSHPPEPLTWDEAIKIGWRPFYAAPQPAPARVPLTHAKDRHDQGSSYIPGYGYVETRAVRAIEAAHGITAQGEPK